MIEKNYFDESEDILANPISLRELPKRDIGKIAAIFSGMGLVVGAGATGLFSAYNRIQPSVLRDIYTVAHSTSEVITATSVGGVLAGLAIMAFSSNENQPQEQPGLTENPEDLL